MAAGNNGVEIEHIPGFSTEKSCETAAERIPDVIKQEKEYRVYKDDFTLTWTVCVDVK